MEAMAILAKTLLLAAILASGCTPAFQIEWEDPVLRAKVNEVITQTNNLEQRVEVLEAENAGGD